MGSTVWLSQGHRHRLPPKREASWQVPHVIVDRPSSLGYVPDTVDPKRLKCRPVGGLSYRNEPRSVRSSGAMYLVPTGQLVAVGVTSTGHPASDPVLNRFGLAGHRQRQRPKVVPRVMELID